MPAERIECSNHRTPEYPRRQYRDQEQPVGPGLIGVDRKLVAVVKEGGVDAVHGVRTDRLTRSSTASSSQALPHASVRAIVNMTIPTSVASAISRAIILCMGAQKWVELRGSPAWKL